MIQNNYKLIYQLSIQLMYYYFQRVYAKKLTMKFYFAKCVDILGMLKCPASKLYIY